MGAPGIGGGVRCSTTTATREPTAATTLPGRCLRKALRAVEKRHKPTTTITAEMAYTYEKDIRICDFNIRWYAEKSKTRKGAEWDYVATITHGK